jgi:hypothetical protein
VEFQDLAVEATAIVAVQFQAIDTKCLVPNFDVANSSMMVTWWGYLPVLLQCRSNPKPALLKLWDAEVCDERARERERERERERKERAVVDVGVLHSLHTPFGFICRR